MDNTINSTQTIGTTAAILSPQKNGKRVGISIRNSSVGGQVVSLALADNEGAVAGSGIVLAAGQNFYDFTSEGYIAWQGNITVVSSAAGAVLSIFERVML